jgi:hypothetical protein
MSYVAWPLEHAIKRPMYQRGKWQLNQSQMTQFIVTSDTATYT